MASDSDSDSDSSQLAVAASVSHGIAILCTVFRLVYRGWMRQLWWEDAWAAFALFSDVFCMVWIWTHYLIQFPAGVFGVAFTSVMWAARMSIIFSIIRVANRSGYKIHKRITYLIAASFVCMWVAVAAQKITTCIYKCQTTHAVAVSQLITDVVADVSLIAAPLHFWKNVGLSRHGKILILSVFGSSLLITIVTIPHCIMLFQSATQTTLIFAHVKTALSLVICNVLVIVTFAYRVCWKETLDPDKSLTSTGIFSSVVVAQFPFNTISRASPSINEETATAQTVQGMKNASAFCAEEGTSTER
ncbi:uncharacterized protein EDB91DRAFT_1161922 [Suillus paluster]|uniref:uncharacterized protein n=1 Tax=Suillus paluster TaxID=48578 RepID=UPI001B87510D|nr:uncharacterized protein EDB91DRAFT_1161922 [Suillus paluster]KAG1728534.1 hypothetical protein EDB91DRAFT_1161922 [Suillus paluster]